jgi:hypothetical protein
MHVRTGDDCGKRCAQYHHFLDHHHDHGRHDKFPAESVFARPMDGGDWAASGLDCSTRRKAAESSWFVLVAHAVITRGGPKLRRRRQQRWRKPFAAPQSRYPGRNFDGTRNRNQRNDSKHQRLHSGRSIAINHEGWPHPSRAFREGWEAMLPTVLRLSLRGKCFPKREAPSHFFAFLLDFAFLVANPKEIALSSLTTGMHAKSFKHKILPASDCAPWIFGSFSAKSMIPMDRWGRGVGPVNIQETPFQQESAAILECKPAVIRLGRISFQLHEIVCHRFCPRRTS